MNTWLIHYVALARDRELGEARRRRDLRQREHARAQRDDRPR
jgi:hypothetical protein